MESLSTADRAFWLALVEDDDVAAVEALAAGADHRRRVDLSRFTLFFQVCAAAKKKGQPSDPRAEQLYVGGLFRPSDGETPRTWTPLQLACHYGLPQTRDALLAVGSDPNQADEKGRTPLLIAVRQGNLEAAQALLAAGADPNQVQPEKYSPLVRAAGELHLALVRLLLEHGAQTDLRDGAGNTALLSACWGWGIGWNDTYPDEKHSFASVSNTLRMADTLAPLQTRMETARARSPVRCAVVQLLLEHGADVEAEGPKTCLLRGRTPLCQAAVLGDANVVELLLAAGAQPHASGRTTPLHVGIAYPDVVAYLLDAGADVDATDADGRTPVELAVRQGAVETLDVLSLAGVDLHRRHPKTGALLLHSAAYHGQAEVVRHLLEAGLPIDAICAKTRRRRAVTPLMLAAGQGHRESVALLLERGADPQRQDGRGATAYDYAHARAGLPTVLRSKRQEIQDTLALLAPLP